MKRTKKIIKTKKHKSNIKNILLIEIGDENLKDVHFFLSNSGYSVDEVCEENKILKCLKNKIYSLIILNDVNYLKKIRKFYPDLPIIIIKSEPTIKDTINAIKYKVSDFITKPFEKEELDLCIQSAYKKEKEFIDKEYKEKARILIVDDDRLIRKRLSKILKLDGYETQVLEDGLGLIEKLELEPIDLIILDINLPYINGIELLKQIRETDPNIVIILITGFATLEKTKNAIEYGASDFFQKPIDYDKLKQSIEKNLSKQSLEVKAHKLLLKVNKSNALLEDKTKQLEDSYKQLTETTSQLIQTSKLATLGDFTAGITHELNQPLNVMKITIQAILRDLMKDRFDKVDGENDLQELLSQINKMAGIIDNMRIFSPWNMKIEKEPVNINILVSNVFRLLNQQFKNHRIKLIKELSSDLPDILGCRYSLQEMLRNLIINARNAVDTSNKENKEIIIKTYTCYEDNNQVFEITDNGVGISEDVKNKIFQPFFTTNDTGKGTGLGLTISNRIVQDHKGKIEFKSNINEGTTFKVKLPIKNQ